MYFGVFRKMNIFWVLNFCEYLGGGGGHHNIGLYLRAISMHFKVFFKVNGQNGEYFFSCLNLEFNLIFGRGGGCLKFLIFFFFGGGGG